MPYKDRQKRLEQSREWYRENKAIHNQNRKKYYTPKESGLPPQFIAVDGEGIDIDGRHIYTYLAASSGTHIRGWDDGISTRDCFQFLLSLRKTGRVLCGFSVGYDCNMFLRDIPPNYLQHLWNNNECILQLDNTWYKLVYVPAKFLNVAEISDVRLDDKQQIKYKTVRSVRLWDVFGFFQGSFMSTIESGGWISQDEMGADTLELIRHMKEERKQFSSMDRQEIEFYCREECRILQELMTRLADTLWSVDIKLRSWHGAGAVSGHLLKQHNIQDTLYWVDLPEIVREASLWSYFGGRVELHQQGPIKPPLYDYDRVSAYPSTICDLPNLRMGEWYGVGAGEVNVYNPFCKYGMWEVEWDIPGKHPQSWLPPFPQRGRDGAIYWVNKGKGWYHTSEVLAALSVFGSHIKVLQGIYFVDESNSKPFSWVHTLLDRRVEYKKNADPRHIVLKLALNSLYGKLAQGTGRNGRRPPFQNFYLAGYITAGTRAAMFRAASNLYHSDSVCIATDGLFCTREIDGLDLSGDPGAWELKIFDEPTFFAQAGVYYSPSGNHVRTRGFHPHSMDYERLETAWRTTPDYARPDIKLGYTENRFVGLGYACLTGHWNEYRRWIDRERFLALRTEPRKLHDMDREDESSAYLLYPGVMDVERQPYQGKERIAEQVAKYPDTLLDLIVLLDQPDFLS